MLVLLSTSFAGSKGHALMVLEGKPQRHCLIQIYIKHMDMSPKHLITLASTLPLFKIKLHRNGISRLHIRLFYARCIKYNENYIEL
jgi:hypothetical protein